MTEEPKPPPFRKDLQLYPGPKEPDGSPTFNLFDPMRSQYYKITWGESLVFQHFKPGMTIQELSDVINQRTTATVTAEEVTQFFLQAKSLNLLELPKASEQISEEAEMMKSNPIKWILLHYLYIRIPLVKPDDFLQKTLQYVLPFASKWAMWTYIILGGIGITMTFTRIEEYFGTFPYFFNLGGVFIYAISLTSVKIVHEFAHAYTAKYYKTRVATMGIAFLVLWPVLYTDVTDSWKLASRKQRLAITGAGVISELIIAALCTLGWALTEPGLLQSVFFVLSSASWLSTLLVNINPAMRFDGYYLLSDIWGIDNLQQRAFAMTRWKLRKIFLGLDLAPPETGLSNSRIRGMMIYSIYTWIYRIILYTTIAVFIYVTFTKVLGIFLFILEIGLFILWPIWSELQILYMVKGYIKPNLRLITSVIVVTLTILWLAIPIPRWEWFSAITVPVEEQIVYVPFSSEIKEIYVRRGDHLKTGQILAKLKSKRLENKISELQVERELQMQEEHILSIQEEGQPFIREKQARLSAVEEELKGFQEKYKDLILKAKIDGTLYVWDQNLRTGMSVKENRILGKISHLNQLEALCFVPEDLISTIKVGQKALFLAESTNEYYEGTIREISQERDEVLNYPQLASIYAGDLPVIEKDQDLTLLQSYYIVKVKLDAQNLKYGVIGDVRITTPPRSRLMHFIHQVLSLLWRESGF